MIYVLTGNGQGKTSCSGGMGARAACSGKKVLMIQFLKHKDSFNQGVVGKIKNFKFSFFSRKCFVMPKRKLDRNPSLTKLGIQPIGPEDFRLIRRGFDLAIQAAQSQRYDFIILDEITLAVKYGLLNKAEVIAFLNKYGHKIDIVMTGRYCPKDIIKVADLVTELREIKHPYKIGLKQRRGREY